MADTSVMGLVVPLVETKRLRKSGFHMKHDELSFNVCVSCRGPKAIPSFVFPVANDNAPEHALRPGFLSTFALATDQGSKLGLSKNKSIICYYNTYQVVQFNRLPLVVSFIASSSANTGLIVSLEKELAPLFEELRQVVEVS
ncbi:ragulator complex protein LAMTOR3 [Phoca vitulina]|uniref:ragulator complex protein LAMTOR3 n=1 Tax=Phoca vitulina TaxID=9720 RepID=UPI0013961729|nr:ragulator complex protein LAMTOR3 [Phoca vitulina]